MVEEKYIWCRNCNEIHHVSPFDKAPAYLVSPGEVRELLRDDWREFMQRHAGHRLEGLRSIGEKYFPSGYPMDSMKVGYIEVTNGQDLFLLRSSRKSVDEPLRFELIRGRLAATGVRVEVRENEIRKEMRYHFSWAPSERPEEEKIEMFIRLLDEVVKDLAPREIKICGYDYNDSSVAYGFLEPHIVDALMQRCRPYFNHDELKAIRRFIDTHREGDDVLTLLVKQPYRIDESIK